MGHYFSFFVEPSTGKPKQKISWCDVNSVTLLAVPTVDSPLPLKPEGGIFAPLGDPLVWDYFLKTCQAILALMELGLQMYPPYHTYSIKPI